jgi:hypothetical protein
MPNGWRFVTSVRLKYHPANAHHPTRACPCPRGRQAPTSPPAPGAIGIKPRATGTPIYHNVAPREDFTRPERVMQASTCPSRDCAPGCGRSAPGGAPRRHLRVSRSPAGSSSFPHHIGLVRTGALQPYGHIATGVSGMARRISPETKGARLYNKVDGV